MPCEGNARPNCHVTAAVAAEPVGTEYLVKNVVQGISCTSANEASGWAPGIWCGNGRDGTSRSENKIIRNLHPKRPFKTCDQVSWAWSVMDWLLCTIAQLELAFLSSSRYLVLLSDFCLVGHWDVSLSWRKVIWRTFISFMAKVTVTSQLLWFPVLSGLWWRHKNDFSKIVGLSVSIFRNNISEKN